MFIYISKLVPPLIYPLGLACVLLFSIIVFRKHHKWQTTAAILALFILWGCSIRWSAYPLARSLEWRYLPSSTVPTADAIVVLGGGTEPAIAPRPNVGVNSAGDRVLYAARLYKDGKAPHILLSGGSIDWMEPGSGGSPAQQMAEIMTFIGIPQEALWLENESQNTYENALFSKKILEEKGIRRILLVTSALHMPRAVALFEHQGLEVIPAPTDYAITEAAWQNLTEGELGAQILGLLPSVSSLSMTTNSLKEYIGMFIYHLQGWL